MRDSRFQPATFNLQRSTLFFIATALTAHAAPAYLPATLSPPKPARELRAAWVATVGNLDWPSKPGLSTASQKAELVALLDRAERLKLNAVIFQVRPACDALYPSALEPWSEYLTGTMGKPPRPYYDPLAFAIDEAHKRGLELHAWFNPYRAKHISAKSPFSPNHVSKTHPELVRQYGKYLWLDPGEKDVQTYTLNVVMDVVRRYDIDGVHFDDYFYPYKEKDRSGKDLEFPDEQSWRRFGAGGKLGREDWRRENVNTFIQRVYDSIKATKPWVKFGVSPFGIWRSQNPPQIKGLDAYAQNYADSRKWLANGWVDYFAPQLYWPIDPPETSFPVLLKWWAAQNVRQRLICPGLNTCKVGHPWKSQEILDQIRLTRRQPGASGHVHWDMSALMHNSSLANALEREVYSQPALVPACPWLNHTPLPKPVLSAVAGKRSLTVSWTASGSEAIIGWVLQTCRSSTWSTELLPAGPHSRVFHRPFPDAIALSAIDRCGNASPHADLERQGD